MKLAGREIQSANFGFTDFVTNRAYTAFQKEAHRLYAAVAVIERPTVHVHTHEGVRLGPVEAARILHRMI